jgi:hypothetical protein
MHPAPLLSLSLPLLVGAHVSEAPALPCLDHAAPWSGHCRLLVLSPPPPSLPAPSPSRCFSCLTRMPTLGPPPLPHPAPASKDVGRSRAPFFPPPRAFLLHQITPRSALLYSLSGASCRGHNTAVKSRLSATTDSTSSVSTPPPSLFSVAQPCVLLTTSALPRCCRTAPRRRRPPGVATASGTSPPIPDSATFPPTGCSGKLPLPSACRAGSPSPPCARVGRPGASSLPVSPCRTLHHAAYSARTW